MPIGEPLPLNRPTRQNLWRVWLIRCLLIVALAALLAGLRLTTDLALPWQPLLLALALFTLTNLGLLWRLRQPHAISEWEFFANLCLDLLFLTVWLYFSGGSTNPLVSYYLIPLVISAAVLRAPFTWALVLLSLLAYTGLLFFYQPLALFVHAGHGGMLNAHFTGMWINFAFSAFLIAWFVVRMANTMRAQQQSIAAIREQGLRDEQIISAASIAAGTAHELRTPLATMALLVDDMQAQATAPAEDLGLLQQQIERCEAILAQLVSSNSENQQLERLTADTLLKQLMDAWQLARPEVAIELALDPAAAQLHIQGNQALRHALLNFLNNAADASPQQVQLQAMQDQNQLLIAISDRGPGIPGDIAETLGKRYVTGRQDGLGLGVLLSSATIERLHGEVQLLERAGGGTRLEIRLPLAGPAASATMG
jgi:two-component system sensor histidine kinase RegB